MHVFISAGEPSGDLHGASLARAIRDLQPSVTITGFGGDQMRAAGCNLLYPLAEHAIMGLGGIVRALPTMIRLLDRMTGEFKRRRPDAVVLIDYPGFHWHVARRVKVLGVPVISFVPPQIWAWLSHRVRKMRANFTEVLCALPFEEPWFRERGLAARYVGHPYFDALAAQQPDKAFLCDQRRRGGPIVGILPGSRQGEIDRNLELLVGAMKVVHVARPDARFLVGCFRPGHRDQVKSRLQGMRLPAEVLVGRTPEVIALADACAAVSGSVGLELLYRRVPTVVVYRVNPLYVRLRRILIKVPYVSLVNLLADRELYPEFVTSSTDPSGPAAPIIRWLNHPPERQAVRDDLDRLLAVVGRPGACRRAAEAVIDLVSRRASAPTAA